MTRCTYEQNMLFREYEEARARASNHVSIPDEDYGVEHEFRSIKPEIIAAYNAVEKKVSKVDLNNEEHSRFLRFSLACISSNHSDWKNLDQEERIQLAKIKADQVYSAQQSASKMKSSIEAGSALATPFVSSPLGQFALGTTTLLTSAALNKNIKMSDSDARDLLHDVKCSDHVDLILYIKDAFDDHYIDGKLYSEQNQRTQEMRKEIDNQITQWNEVLAEFKKTVDINVGEGKKNYESVIEKISQLGHLRGQLVQQLNVQVTLSQLKEIAAEKDKQKPSTKLLSPTIVDYIAGVAKSIQELQAVKANSEEFKRLHRNITNEAKDNFGPINSLLNEFSGSHHQINFITNRLTQAYYTEFNLSIRQQEEYYRKYQVVSAMLIHRIGREANNHEIYNEKISALRAEYEASLKKLEKYRGHFSNSEIIAPLLGFAVSVAHGNPFMVTIMLGQTLFSLFSWHQNSKDKKNLENRQRILKITGDTLTIYSKLDHSSNENRLAYINTLVQINHAVASQPGIYDPDKVLAAISNSITTFQEENERCQKDLARTKDLKEGEHGYDCQVKYHEGKAKDGHKDHREQHKADAKLAQAKSDEAQQKIAGLSDRMKDNQTLINEHEVQLSEINSTAPLMRNYHQRLRDIEEKNVKHKHPGKPPTPLPGETAKDYFKKFNDYTSKLILFHKENAERDLADKKIKIRKDGLQAYQQLNEDEKHARHETITGLGSLANPLAQLGIAPRAPLVVDMVAQVNTIYEVIKAHYEWNYDDFKANTKTAEDFYNFLCSKGALALFAVQLGAPTLIGIGATLSLYCLYRNFRDFKPDPMTQVLDKLNTIHKHLGQMQMDISERLKTLEITGSQIKALQNTLQNSIDCLTQYIGAVQSAQLNQANHTLNHMAVTSDRKEAANQINKLRDDCKEYLTLLSNPNSHAFEFKKFRRTLTAIREALEKDANAKNDDLNHQSALQPGELLIASYPHDYIGYLAKKTGFKEPGVIDVRLYCIVIDIAHQYLILAQRAIISNPIRYREELRAIQQDEKEGKGLGKVVTALKNAGVPTRNFIRYLEEDPLWLDNLLKQMKTQHDIINVQIDAATAESKCFQAGSGKLQEKRFDENHWRNTLFNEETFVGQSKFNAGLLAYQNRSKFFPKVTFTPSDVEQIKQKPENYLLPDGTYANTLKWITFRSMSYQQYDAWVKNLFEGHIVALSKNFSRELNNKSCELRYPINDSVHQPEIEVYASSMCLVGKYRKRDIEIYLRFDDQKNIAKILSKAKYPTDTLFRLGFPNLTDSKIGNIEIISEIRKILNKAPYLRNIPVPKALRYEITPIFSVDGTLVPLAIPKFYLDDLSSCEEIFKFRNMIRTVNEKGEFFYDLEPYIDAKSKKPRYKLVLIYVVYSQKLGEKWKIFRVTFATFDKTTVHSFKKVTETNSHNIKKILPNYNEFLIMVTSGMTIIPGTKSKSIFDEDLVYSSEIPFPGLMDILYKSTSMCFNFDSSAYDEVAALALEEFVHSSHIDLDPATFSSPIIVEYDAEYENYKKHYEQANKNSDSQIYSILVKNPQYITALRTFYEYYEAIIASITLTSHIHVEDVKYYLNQYFGVVDQQQFEARLQNGNRMTFSVSLELEPLQAFLIDLKVARKNLLVENFLSDLKEYRRNPLVDLFVHHIERAEKLSSDLTSAPCSEALHDEFLRFNILKPFPLLHSAVTFTKEAPITPAKSSAPAEDVIVTPAPLHSAVNCTKEAPITPAKSSAPAQDVIVPPAPPSNLEPINEKYKDEIIDLMEKSTLITLMKIDVECFNNEISYQAEAAQRNVILVYELLKRKISIRPILRNNVTALDCDQGIIILYELNDCTSSSEKENNDVAACLQHYLSSLKSEDKQKPIYIPVHFGGAESGHYCTLVVNFKERKYRYINPLRNGNGDFDDNEMLNRIQAKLQELIPGVTSYNIRYNRQQPQRHNNECFFHNVFDMLHMLLKGPSVDLAKMREDIGPIPGTNPSRNGGIDPNDTEYYLRPFYRRLFTRIFKDMHNEVQHKSGDGVKAKRHDAYVRDLPQVPRIRAC